MINVDEDVGEEDNEKNVMDSLLAEVSAELLLNQISQ
jgi:hypothetical protein